MIEEVYTYSTTDEKKIEKLIMNEDINYIHMVFNKGEGVPEHYSNANVYMNVIRGTLTINLDDQGVHYYESGNLLQIPISTKMNVSNTADQVLELIVIKAPQTQQ